MRPHLLTTAKIYQLNTYNKVNQQNQIYLTMEFQLRQYSEKCYASIHHETGFLPL